MSNFRRNIPTYVIVTFVTMLIWYWAAAETRDQKPLELRLQIVSPDPNAWVVQPDTTTVRLMIEGSALALEDALGLNSRPLTLELGTNDLPLEPGHHSINLVDVLQRADAIARTGVTILSCDPPVLELEIDEMVRVAARVSLVVPNIRLENKPAIHPETVDIVLPSRLRGTLAPQPTVEAVAISSQIAQLEPGRLHRIELPVQTPENLRLNDDVRIVPPTVQVSLTIASTIRETTLDTVRVQVAGPHETANDFKLELDPTILRNVSVRGEAEIINAIESGRAIVVAFVHLSARDLENRITEKPVSFFEALSIDDGARSASTNLPITALIDGRPARPIIGIRIEPVGGE